MVKDISIAVPPSKEKDKAFIFREIISQLKKTGIEFEENDVKPVFVKKSIDARHKSIKLFLKYKVFIAEDETDETKLPEWKDVHGGKQVIIVGAGPAGLFASLRLMEKGLKPVIIERGSETSKRKRDIAQISRTGNVNGNSNYCFGEGGAGTFSDGKLYTRSNKRGDISSVLRIFHHFGADEKILTDAHPHIGTDRLPSIINSMRNFIVEKGGEIHFDTLCTDFIIEGKKILGVMATDTVSGEKSEFRGEAVMVATGHSACDIYELLARTDIASLEAKTFAVGVRAEHPRETIDSIQFHGKSDISLGSAEYRFTSQQKDRGVYSFCMCPGGFVVPSASAADQIVVNGMSAARRNSRWSNAAIVVEIRPEDIPVEFVEQSKEKYGEGTMAGLLWRTWLEEETFRHGEGQKAPAQRLVDFLARRDSQDLPETSYAPGVVASRLDSWLPVHISERLDMGFRYFDIIRKGFICKDALLIATETRTSTPVRMKRNRETFESECLENLYPAGEGSGYAGGIVSSAMDGENSALKIADKILCGK